MPARFWVFAAFLGLVFLTGGGSRDDVASLVILRPACAFFAAYALTIAVPGDLTQFRVPLLLLLALAVWMVIQLVPLPPAIWGGLPGRAALLEVDRLVGLDGTWRPISLSPSKTMNSLASLVVPATGLLLYAVQANDDRRRILGLLIAAAGLSALFGIGQYASGGSGPLYLYSVTNDGYAVGLFANRNHNAVFLASTFVIAGYLFAEYHRLSSRSDRSVKPILAAGICLLVLLTLLISGSRAGLLIGVLGLGLGFALYVASRRAEVRSKQHRKQRLVRHLPVAAVMVITAAVALFLSSRSSSFDRLVSLSPADEIRVQVFPQILAMVQDNWLLGAGFGSFEHVYRAYEASGSLNPTYFNNAHNDWMQWVIEGGLPAILIFVAFVLWLASAFLGHWRKRDRNPPQTRLVATAIGVLLLLLIASALDYPLRVPSIMLYAVLMVALAADPPQPLRKAERRGPVPGKGRMRRVSMPSEFELKGAVR